MAKSFCNGCKFWKKCSFGNFFGGGYFMYCKKINKHELKDRKELCGGQYYDGQGDKEEVE